VRLRRSGNVFEHGSAGIRSQRFRASIRRPWRHSDNFYTRTGRCRPFGFRGGRALRPLRQFRPAGAHLDPANWVVDNNCTVDRPRTCRVLATTGGYVDDGTKSPTDFISIIAFLLTRSSSPASPTPARPRWWTSSATRGYAALKQRSPTHFRATPCGTWEGKKPCFPVTSVATPNSGRLEIPASNRIPSTAQWQRSSRQGQRAVSNSPFGYFCDDAARHLDRHLFLVHVDPANPGPVCGPILAALAQQNGVSLMERLSSDGGRAQQPARGETDAALRQRGRQRQKWRSQSGS